MAGEKQLVVDTVTGKVKAKTPAGGGGGPGILAVHLFSTPNRLVNIFGDGGANARGLTFAADQDMTRLRLSFRVDSGNNYDVRARLFK